MAAPYTIIRPKGRTLPIVISAPHVGTEIPDSLKAAFEGHLIAPPVDTDWLVHELYPFSVDMGITLIHARYSRYVIDLNRDPANRKLYADQRLETSLCPTRTFGGEPLYKDRRTEISSDDLDQRKALYYWPYYEAIQREIDHLRLEHRHVLLYDAHSIARLVPTIRSEPFPDMILGDNEGKSAHPSVIESALTALTMSAYSVFHNTPFKGGHITRYFGKPAEGVHALQLERSQDIYLQPGQYELDAEKAGNLTRILKAMFEGLALTLAKMNAGKIKEISMSK